MVLRLAWLSAYWCRSVAQEQVKRRVQEQKGSEVQAALRQVASEAGRASRANSDLISCREACKALEEQLAQADRR